MTDPAARTSEPGGRMSDVTISIENLTKTFRQPTGESLTVLQGISFGVSEGDFVIVLGESGCGKSTLLSLVAGLTPATDGRIEARGELVTAPHPSRSILFQQPSLLPWLNVADNIVFGCRLRGERKDLELRANQLIEIMGLAGFEHHYPHELSLGMAQRACLARSLIGHPEILLLDEPFASLDTITRTHLQDELIEFWMVEKFTAIFVTHDIDEAILLGNRIVLLGGRPCRVLETLEVNLNYPRDITSRSFFMLRAAILRKLREGFSDHHPNPGERGTTP